VVTILDCLGFRKRSWALLSGDQDLAVEWRCPPEEPCHASLSTAFHKYAYESVRPEEAWKAVSKGEAVVDSPEEYVAILMKHSTKHSHIRADWRRRFDSISQLNDYRHSMIMSDRVSQPQKRGYPD